MNDRQLNELIDGLPARIEPERDLWPDIEKKLGRANKVSRLGFRGIAAGIIAALFALGIFLAPNQTNSPAERPPTAAPMAVISTNIEAVNQSIARVRQALRLDPTSPSLQDLLRHAYAARNRLMIQKMKLTLRRSIPS